MDSSSQPQQGSFQPMPLQPGNLQPQLQPVSFQPPPPQQSSSSSSSSSSSTTIRKRLPDAVRVKKLAEELSAKKAFQTIQNTGQFKRYRVDQQAQELLLTYVTELASGVLEEACLLSKHRHSGETTAVDINLVFEKKFGIDASGYQSHSKRKEQLAIAAAAAAATMTAPSTNMSTIVTNEGRSDENEAEVCEEEKEEQRGVQKEGFENKVEEQQPVVGQETQR